MSEHTRHPGIVVGVDGSPASTIAVQWAVGKGTTVQLFFPALAVPTARRNP